jgi:cold shock CspA family protein
MNAHVRKYVPSGTYGFLSAPGVEIFFHLWVFDTLGGPPPIVGEEVEVEIRGEQPETGLPRAERVVRLFAPALKTGTVTKFDPAKGYGFVTDLSGGTYYLHKSDISPPWIPTPGSVVTFYVGQRTEDGHRPRACHVTSAR